MCREPLSDAFREELRPKTENERKRLEQSLARLEGIGDMFKHLESKQKKRIMAQRSREFGIERTGFKDYLKVAFPVILLVLAIFVIVIAINE